MEQARADKVQEGEHVQSVILVIIIIIIRVEKGSCMGHHSDMKWYVMKDSLTTAKACHPKRG
jgi:hypothetical protein